MSNRADELNRLRAGKHSSKSERDSWALMCCDKWPLCDCYESQMPPDGHDPMLFVLDDEDMPTVFYNDPKHPAAEDTDDTHSAEHARGETGEPENPADADGAQTPCVIDLQWFASAEDEGRTEPPSEQKIRRAREEGRVARSSDLSTAVVLLFAVAGIGLLARYLYNNLAEVMQFFLLRGTANFTLEIGALLRVMFRYYLRIVGPILALTAVGALLGNIMQVGFLFTTKPLQPDFKRIIPKVGRYLQRTFFSPEAGFNLLKSWVKLAIIGIVGVTNVVVRLDIVVNTLHAPIGQSVGFFIRLMYSILLQTAVLLVVFALFDYQFQRYRHRESLRMTRQETKEERKQQDGDPLVRSRLRQRMQAVLTSNMIRNVPQADVVITNPTHYAVALEYNSLRMNAPTVIAKGSDLVAQRIREVAYGNEVPIIENKPLARGLYNEVEIGDTIPEKFYEVVVTILAEIYKLNGGLKGVAV